MTIPSAFLSLQARLAVCALGLVAGVAGAAQNDSPAKGASARFPAVAVGILILPLFDTLRVFVVRIFKGKSPLHPDRSHIHHLLLDAGLSHMQATTVLLIVNLAFIFFVVSFQDLGNLKLLIIILMMASLLTFIPAYITRYKKRASVHQEGS